MKTQRISNGSALKNMFKNVVTSTTRVTNTILKVPCRTLFSGAWIIIFNIDQWAKAAEKY
jgi:hypothetical protein